MDVTWLILPSANPFYVLVYNSVTLIRSLVWRVGAFWSHSTDRLRSLDNSDHTRFLLPRIRIALPTTETRSGRRLCL